VQPSPSTLPSTLLIGSEALLSAWAKYAPSAPQVVGLVHSDVQRALDMIDLVEAQVIVMEQAAAASEIGSVLMIRLHNERSWRGTEIRLLTADQAARVMNTEPGEIHPQIWLRDLAHPLPPRPHRRAPRIRADGTEQALIDGDAVTLVDWSSTGAQVHSPAVLRPLSRVRVKLSRAQTSVKTAGTVVWSAFESTPFYGYRAGIAFAEPISDLASASPEHAAMPPPRDRPVPPKSRHSKARATASGV
jgi:hypothetical protein